MTNLLNLTAPKTIANHAGVDRVVAGDDQGSDSKYWVFLKEGWGYYESGQRDEYCWISGGFGVDSVADFRSIGVEYRPEKDLSLQSSSPDGDSPSFEM